MRKSNSAERLKEMIEVLNITQQDICDRTGLSKSVVSMYIHGKREPRQDSISMICEAFNVEPAWIMGFDVPMRLSDADLSDDRFAPQNAAFVAEISKDIHLLRLVKKFKALPEDKQRHIEDLINLFSE